MQSIQGCIFLRTVCEQWNCNGIVMELPAKGLRSLGRANNKLSGLVDKHWHWGLPRSMSPGSKKKKNPQYWAGTLILEWIGIHGPSQASRFSFRSEFLMVVVIQLISHVRHFVTPWAAACRVSCPSLSPETAHTQVHWVGDAIQPSHPLSPPSPPALKFPRIRIFSKESVLHIRWPKYWSFPVNIQGWFPLGLTGLISLQSQGLSKSSPAPQFESINSLALGLLYGPTLTSIHDYWKNHSFA